MKQIFLLLLGLFVIQSNAYALTSADLVEKCKVALEQLPEAESKQAAVKRFLDVGTWRIYWRGSCWHQLNWRDVGTTKSDKIKFHMYA